MKTKTITVREGELLGPIDWNFDFKDIYPAICNGEESHERMFQRAMTILQMLEKDPDKYEATTDGGWPRCGWGSIVHIGMYDGWPYWKPVPSVFITSMFVGDWHSFDCITNIRVKGEQRPLKIDIERGLPSREAIIKSIFDTHTTIRKVVNKMCEHGNLKDRCPCIKCRTR